MKILGYKGIGLISWLIRFQTRSKYSHIGVQLNDGTVIEAWHVGGVRHVATPWTDHNPKTEIDFFQIEGKFNQDQALQFMKNQLGKKYDFRSIIRFITRRPGPVNDRWFCSELAVVALMHGGVYLQARMPPSHVTPRDVCMSPTLKLIRTVKGEKENHE